MSSEDISFWVNPHEELYTACLPLGDMYSFFYLLPIAYFKNYTSIHGQILQGGC